MRASEGPRRWVGAAILAGLLVGGVAVRLHGLARSLWLDEAWVANSVLEPSVAAMLRYEAWLQTTPPLLLVLVRAAVALAGESNLAFRAVPALFSLASLGLFAALALRWLPRPAALAALALFAFSPRLALLGASLKPYASDAFCALALLAAGDAYLARPDGRRLAWTLASLAVLAPLSFCAPLFAPALLLAAVPRPGGPPRSPAWHALAIAATAGLAAAALIVLCVLPNREPSLLEYFRAGFFPGGGPAALASWLAQRLRLLAGLGLGASATSSVEPVAAILGALGLADLARRSLAGEASALARSWLLATPIAAALALNLARLLPMARGNPRPLSFLLPVALLAVGAGFAALASAAARIRSRAGEAASAHAGEAASARVAERVGWLAFCTVVAGLATAAFRGELRELFERPPTEEAEGAVAFLAHESGAGDLLYVHSSMRESFRLYAQRTAPRAARVVLGEIDWPCCPRGRAYRRDDEDSGRATTDEIARLAAAGAAGRRVWVLVTDREAHFRQRGRRSPAALERALSRLGCERSATTGFRGVRVDRYECAPERGV